jgi:hypothetical protein
MQTEFVDVEVICEEWFWVRKKPEQQPSQQKTNFRDQSDVEHICDFSFGEICFFVSFFPQKQKAKSLFHAGTPFFDDWERAYASEASLRRGEKKAKKDTSKLVTPAKGVASASKPARPKVTTPSSAGSTLRSRSQSDLEKEEADGKKKQLDMVKIAEWRKRMQEIEELRKTDPLKAAKETEREVKKRLREASGTVEKADKVVGEKKKKIKTGDVSQLKAGFAEVLMRVLKPHLLSGRIADRDSFKHLTRKLTKELVKKEQARGNSTWHPKLSAPAENYANSFMERLKEKGVFVYNMQNSKSV